MDKPILVSVTLFCFVLLFIYQSSQFYNTRDRKTKGQPSPLGFWVIEGEEEEDVTKIPINLSVPEPPQETVSSDWWNGRFLTEEVLNMSALGKRLFVYENQTEDDQAQNNSTHFKILVWRFGQYARKKYVNGYTSKAKDIFATCTVSNCDYFYEDENILEADAVLFYLHASWTNIKHVKDLVALPRKAEQRWVYVSDESQWNTALYPHYEGLFNWSMTFHSQSDVPVPYGRIVRQQDIQGETTDYHSTKPLLVATLQSHCGGDSGRFDYLDELVKHVQVDVWGKCGARYKQSHPCPGWAQECEGLTKYKFYLSFENTLCSEYITEKLWWNAIGRESVPVVIGGQCQRDYTKLLPPQSYINVEDFKSPKALADYLKFLDTNAAEYNKYHEWRKEYKALQEHGYFGTQASHYCRLCEALNYNSKQTKTLKSLQHFFGKENCRPTFIDKHRL